MDKKFMNRSCFSALLISMLLTSSACTAAQSADAPGISPDVTVSYLGPEGTYTEEATELFLRREKR